jgi:hypothetical protein
MSIHGMNEIESAIRSCTPKYMNAPSAPPASTTPTTAVTTDSRRNGSAMYRVDAPTSRMIAISLRRANAASRIVFATSISAATSRKPAIPHEPYWNASSHS